MGHYREEAFFNDANVILNLSSVAVHQITFVALCNYSTVYYEDKEIIWETCIIALKRRKSEI